MTVRTLASSSSGNCTVVSCGDSHVLIDAGISLRRIREGLRVAGLTPDDLACILITHAHIDHIAGLRMLVKYHKTPVFSSLAEESGICGAVPEVEPFINCFETGVEFDLGAMSVKSFRTPHDTLGSVGFSIDAGGKKLVYATDLGYVTEEVLNASLGADIAIIEANHDKDMLKQGSYPQYLKRRILSEHGHLANSDSGDFVAKLAVSGSRFIQLAHLSRENNTPELARKTVEQVLMECGIIAGKDVDLAVAPAYAPGREYTI